MAEIRHEEEVRRPVGQAGAHVRLQLVDRVEGHELDARARVDLLARHEREHPVHGVGGAVVAVADRLFDERAVAVEEGVVDAP